MPQLTAGPQPAGWLHPRHIKLVRANFQSPTVSPEESNAHVRHKNTGGVNSHGALTEKTALHPCPPSLPSEAQSSEEAPLQAVSRAPRWALHPPIPARLRVKGTRAAECGFHPDTAFRSPPDLSTPAKPSSGPLSGASMCPAPPDKPAAPARQRTALGDGVRDARPGVSGGSGQRPR